MSGRQGERERDRQTNMTELIVAFRNVTNTPNYIKTNGQHSVYDCVD